MNRGDLVASFTLHIVMALLILIPASLIGKRTPPGEVVHVSLISAPPMSSATVAPPEPVAIPKALAAEEVDIPIDDPTSKPKVKIEKPEPKPEPEKPVKNKPVKAETADETQAGNEVGPTDVDVAAGSPFAGATVDNVSFDYPHWFNLAFNKIAGNFRNPVNVDGQIICLIYFKVIRSGKVIDARIEESSGFQSFDEACLAAVERSRPFPPLPPEFRDEIIGITVPFGN